MLKSLVTIVIYFRHGHIWADRIYPLLYTVTSRNDL